MLAISATVAFFWIPADSLGQDSLKYKLRIVRDGLSSNVNIAHGQASKINDNIQVPFFYRTDPLRWRIWQNGATDSIAGHTELFNPEILDLNDFGDLLWRANNQFPNTTGQNWLGLNNGDSVSFEDQFSEGASAYVTDINNSGEAIGYSYTVRFVGEFGDTVYGNSSCRWNSAGELAFIYPRPDFFFDSSYTLGDFARGITNTGIVWGYSIGSITPISGAEVAEWVYQGGEYTPFWRTDTSTNQRIIDVSDAGHVLFSEVSYATGYTYFYIYQGGQRSRILPDSLFSFAYLPEAVAVNSRGEVLGLITRNNTRDAFLVRNGVVHYLPETITQIHPGDESLVSNPVRIPLVYDINDYGYILCGDNIGFYKTMVLEPLDTIDFSLHVVNSTDDESDNDLTDGECGTGNILRNGQEECTFRAAVEQANFTPDKDTILFNIPGSIQHYIEFATALPAINGPIVIDAGTAKSGAALDTVILDGSNIGNNSVQILGTGSFIRGLTFQGFDDVALHLTNGGRDTVFGCTFGYNPKISMPERNGGLGILVTSRGNLIGYSGEGNGNYFRANEEAGLGLYQDSNEVFGNIFTGNGNFGAPTPEVTGGGIFVAGSHNRIGDPLEEFRNVCSLNTTGIYVFSGTGNRIQRNRFVNNWYLGIDLEPPGPNLNDTLDIDSGANQKINFPRFDSLNQSLTELRGTMLGEPDFGYVIEFFVSDTCDSNGYGEGYQSLSTTQVTCDESGRAKFDVSTPPPGSYLSMTATHEDKSTSEFSHAWPYKRMRVLDAKENVMTDHAYQVSLVDNNPPIFDEDTLGIVHTDENGMVRLDSIMRTNRDRFLFGSEWSYATHQNEFRSLQIPYKVSVDNAWFDSLFSHKRFQKLHQEPTTDVILGHSTFAFNLDIGFEWVPDAIYQIRFATALKKLVNDLYDASDGQMRLDTVRLHYPIEDAASFNGILIRVYNVDDIQITAGEQSNRLPVQLPRAWYGPRFISTNQFLDRGLFADPGLFANVQLLLAATLHQLLDVRDEQIDGSPCERPMGIMAQQYLSPSSDFNQNFRLYREELSTAGAYSSTGCRATDQWVGHFKSGWEHFQGVFEKVYDGQFAEVLLPDEREAGALYYPGPNEFDPNLDIDYDLERFLIIQYEGGPPAPPFSRLKLTGQPFGAKVFQIIPESLNEGVRRSLYQGKTAEREEITGEKGVIFILGKMDGDSIRVLGGTLEPLGFSQLRQSTQLGTVQDFEWYSSVYAITGTDSASPVPYQVQGNFPLIGSLESTAGELRLTLRRQSPLPQIPTGSVSDETGYEETLTFTEVGNSYEATLIADSLTKGMIWVETIDDSGQTFFFTFEYDLVKNSPTTYLASSERDATISFSGVDSSRVASILSTEYPIISNGLAVEAVSASRVFAVEWADGSRSVDHTLSLRYSTIQLDSSVTPWGQESNIQIFKWDDANAEWQILNSVLDTANNLVSSQIASPGIYAAFTSDIVTDIGDEPNTLPYRFELAQNYPNPFNPTTTINFSLPNKSQVVIEVLNSLGQRVKTLVDREISAGDHSVEWNATNSAGKPVASGMYLYRIAADEFVSVKKMMLLR